MNIRRVTVTGVAAVVLGLGSLVAAPAASAEPASCPQTGSNSSPGGGHTTSNTPIRIGPSTACKATATALTTDTLDYYCWYQTGPNYETWTYVRDGRSNVFGWIPDNNLTGHGASIHC